LSRVIRVVSFLWGKPFHWAFNGALHVNRTALASWAPICKPGYPRWIELRARCEP